jgi:hypothetical protein
MLSERLAFILSLDAQGAVRGFETVGREADRHLGKADDRLDRLGGQMTRYGAAAMATAGVAAAGLFKLGSAADQQKAAYSALNQVLGQSTDKVAEFATTSVRSVGLSRTATYEVATSFGAIAKAGGLGGEAVSDFSIRHVQMAADLAAFKNTSPQQAIQDMESAYAGASIPLRKYNIYLDEAGLKQAYLRETGEKVTGTLTAQQRIIAVHSEVVRQGADMWGQWDREINEANAQQVMLRANLQDLAAGIGQGVVPAMSDMLGGLNSVVTKVNELDPKILQGAGSFAAYGTAALGAVGALSFLGGQAIKARDRFTTLGEDGSKSLNKLGAAAGIAGAAGGMFALASALDPVLNRSKSLTKIVEDLSRATDGELVTAFHDEFKLLISLGREAEAYEHVARTNIGTAERLADALDRQGGRSDELRAAIERERDAQRRMNADGERGAKIIDDQLTPAVEDLTDELGGLTGAARDADDRIGKLRDALMAAFDQDLGYDAAVRRTADALDDLTEAGIKAYTTVDDATTPIDEAAAAQRGYEAAIDKAAESALKQAEQAVKTAEKQAIANGSTLDAADANRILVDELDKVRDTLEPGSPLRQKLDEYVDGLRGIPAKVETDLTLKVTEVASAGRWSTPPSTATSAPGSSTRSGRRAVISRPATPSSARTARSGSAAPRPAGR